MITVLKQCFSCWKRYCGLRCLLIIGYFLRIKFIFTISSLLLLFRIDLHFQQILDSFDLCKIPCIDLYWSLLCSSNSLFSESNTSQYLRFCNYLFNSWTNILNYQRVTCWCLWEVFLYFTLFKILKSTNRKDSCHFFTIFQACKYQHVDHSKAKLLNFFWAFWKQLTSLFNLIILSYGSFVFFNDGLETVWQTVGFGILN